ncbi:mucin-5AC [Hyalella azteca]|uniref:Mucin-5AC n=1 Tax=Hyalella azteca TaxID=294128 RepID=A0A979FQJ0_HYAAZ|nr:mucin-5AC [Hyalella azteca]
MLMCYLKVCPFSKPIGLDCKIEKSPDQCCPVITCPQVPVNLQVMHMTTSTTSAPAVMQMTGIVPYVEHGCTVEEDYFPDGAQMPGNVSKPCELCYCIRNHTACIMQECILKVEGCVPVFQEGICCPVRYQCAHEEEDTFLTTTQASPQVNATTGLPFSTVIPGSISGACIHQGEIYADGALIETDDPCEHCYCMKGDLVCAIHECKSSLDEADEGCLPRPPLPGQCCPQGYTCPDQLETTSLQPDAAAGTATVTPATEVEDVDPKEEEHTTPSAVVSPVSDLSETYKPITHDDGIIETRITAGKPLLTEPADGTKPVHTVTLDIGDSELESTQSPLTTPAATEIDDDLLINSTVDAGKESVTKTPEYFEPTSAFINSTVTVNDSRVSTTPETSLTESVTDSPISQPDDKFVTSEQPSTEFPATEKPKPSSTETATDSGIPLDTSETTTLPEEHETTTTAVVVTSVITSDSRNETKTTEKPTEESHTEPGPGLPEEEKEIDVTSPPPIVTTEGIPGEGDCMMNSITYSNGDVVPTSSACEESCTCRDSIVVCKFKSCESPPPSFLRCEPSEIPGECCPRYDCPASVNNRTCEKDGVTYQDGKLVPTSNPCDECFCVEGKIICAIRECLPPAKGCVPVSQSDDGCCPTAYECPSIAPGVADLVMVTEKPQGVNETLSTSCKQNGKEFRDGDAVPTSDLCQESCLCKDGDLRCIKKACPSPPPSFRRCLKIEDSKECCPSYECPPPAVDGGASCRFGGIDYTDGELVPSLSNCEECFCQDGEVICAELECRPPGPNCIPALVEEGSCCPSSYDCSEQTPELTFTSPEFSVDTVEDTPVISTVSGDFKNTSDGTTIGIDAGSEVPDSKDSSDGVTVSQPNATSSVQTSTTPKKTVDSHMQADTTATEVSSVQDYTEASVFTYNDTKTTVFTKAQTSTEVPSSETVQAETQTTSYAHTTPPSLTPETDIRSSAVTGTGETMESESATIDGIENATTLSPLATETGTAAQPFVSKITTTTASSITETKFNATPSGTGDEVTTVGISLVTETPSVVANLSDTKYSTPDIIIDSQNDTIPELITESSLVDDISSTSANDLSKTPSGQTEFSTVMRLTPSETPEGFVVVDHSTTVMPIENLADHESTSTVKNTSTGSTTKFTELDYKSTTAIPEGIEKGVVSTVSISEDGTFEYGDSTTLNPIHAYEASSSTTPLTELEKESDIIESTSIEPTTERFTDVCVVDGRTYSDGETIQTNKYGGWDSCHKSCVCKKSVVECTLLACPPAPPSALRCKPVEDPGQCCPSYDCEEINPGGDPALTCNQEGQIFKNGQYVPSAFECVDCYCIDAVVTCAKVVCQIPAGNCTPSTVLPGECCPSEYSCREPEAQITESALTTQKEQESTTASTPSLEEQSRSCVRDGTMYLHGQSMPVANACQESCKCHNGTAQCKLRACPPSPPSFLRCVPHEKPDQCCPSYECPSGTANETLVTKCMNNGIEYQNGELVPSFDHCSDCYCIDGNVTCAALECQPPAPNCTPNEVPEGHCCPTEYDCSESSPTFGIETDSTPDLTFSAVDETVDGVTTTTPDITVTSEETSVTTEDFSEAVTVGDGTEQTEADGEISTTSQSTVVPEIIETETLLPDEQVVGSTMEPVTESEESAATQALEEGSCVKNNTVYLNGSEVPALAACEESCLCSEGAILCEMQACPPAPPAFLRCSPIQQPEQCCPSYDCPEVKPDPSTTPSCVVNGTGYVDGEYVPGPSYCTDCYCIAGEYICATLDCEAPGENCLPVEIPEGSCCPTRYTCADSALSSPLPEDFTFPVDKISTRFTDVDRPETEVTQPESDTRETVKDTITAVTIETDELTTVRTLLPNGTMVTSGEVSSTASTKPTPAVGDSTGISHTSEPETYGSVADSEVADDRVTVTEVTEKHTTVEEETESTPEVETSTATSPSKLPDVTERPEEGDETSEHIPSAVTQTSVVDQVDSESTSTPGYGEVTEQFPDDSTDHTDESVGIYNETTTTLEEIYITTPAFGVTESPSMGRECTVDGIVYSDGSSVPVLNSCQEECQCRNGTLQCDQIACPPAPPAFFRCTQVQTESCCPSYDCALPASNASAQGCNVNGTTFSDGQYIPSGTICKDCYCIDNEVVCATIDCPIPGPNCYALRQSEYGCCPEKYRCDSAEIVTEATATSPPLDSMDANTRATGLTEEIDDVPTTFSPSVGCIVRGILYLDGDAVPDKNPCNLCHCSGSRVVCSPRQNCSQEIKPDADSSIIEHDDGTPTLLVPSTELEVKFTHQPADETEDVVATRQQTETTDVDIVEGSITTVRPSVAVDATTEITVETESPYVPVTESVTGDSIETSTVFEEDAVTSAPDDETNTTVSSLPDTEPTVATESSGGYDETTSEVTEPTDAVTDFTSEDTTDIPVTTSATDAPACYYNGIEYTNGSSVPPNKCQDNCICINGEVSCQQAACPPAPPAFLRCVVSERDACCPSYQCPNETETTTVGPTCIKEGQSYSEGDHVPSPDVCSDCFCVDGRIVCATLECEAPGPRCTPAPVPEGVCCPESYDCIEEIQESGTTLPPSATDATETAEPLDSTTASPPSSDAVNVCVVGGVQFGDGEDVPVENSCQESCSCSSGDLLCVLRKCPDKPPSFLRCAAVRNSTDQCCPTYECPPATNIDASSCKRDGITYADGDYVNSTNVCTDCYCVQGEIVCATLECEAPSARCIPMPATIEECCPASYLCPGEGSSETSTESATTISPEETSTVAETSESEHSSTESSVGSISEVTEAISESVTSTPEEGTDQVITETEVSASISPSTESSVGYTNEVTDVPSELITVTPEEVTDEAVTDVSPSTLASDIGEGDTTPATAEESTSEKPVEGEISSGPISDDPSHTFPEIKSTEFTDTTTASSSEEAQTTQSSVDIDSTASTDSPIKESETTPSSVDIDSTASTDSPIKETKPTQSSVAIDSTTSASTDDIEAPQTTEPSHVAGTEATTVKSTSIAGEVDETMSEFETSTSISTDESTEIATTASPHTDNFEELTCLVNETVYQDGASLPALGPCQHSCKCANGTVKCDRQSCPPVPPQFLRCSPVPVYGDDQCCPIYSCPPSPGTDSVGEASCVKDGQEFLDGEHVPSPTICTDCYCVDGVIVCAEIDCGVPGPNCSPVYQAEEACCPSTYECQESTPAYPQLAITTDDASDKKDVTYAEPELTDVEIDEPAAITSVTEIGSRNITTVAPLSTGFGEHEKTKPELVTEPGVHRPLTTDSIGKTTVSEDDYVTVTSDYTGPSNVSTLAPVAGQEFDAMTTTIKSAVESVTELITFSNQKPTPLTESATSPVRATTLSSVDSSTDEPPKITEVERISTRITVPVIEDDTNRETELPGNDTRTRPETTKLPTSTDEYGKGVTDLPSTTDYSTSRPQMTAVTEGTDDVTDADKEKPYHKPEFSVPDDVQGDVTTAGEESHGEFTESPLGLVTGVSTTTKKPEKTSTSSQSKAPIDSVTEGSSRETEIVTESGANVTFVVDTSPVTAIPKPFNATTVSEASISSDTDSKVTVTDKPEEFPNTTTSFTPISSSTVTSTISEEPGTGFETRETSTTPNEMVVTTTEISRVETNVTKTEDVSTRITHVEYDSSTLKPSPTETSDRNTTEIPKLPTTLSEGNVSKLPSDAHTLEDSNVTLAPVTTTLANNVSVDIELEPERIIDKITTLATESETLTRTKSPIESQTETPAQSSDTPSNVTAMSTGNGYQSTVSKPVDYEGKLTTEAYPGEPTKTSTKTIATTEALDDVSTLDEQEFVKANISTPTTEQETYATEKTSAVPSVISSASSTDAPFPNVSSFVETSSPLVTESPKDSSEITTLPSLPKHNHTEKTPTVEDLVSITDDEPTLSVVAEDGAVATALDSTTESIVNVSNLIDKIPEKTTVAPVNSSTSVLPKEDAKTTASDVQVGTEISSGLFTSVPSLSTESPEKMEVTDNFVSTRITSPKEPIYTQVPIETDSLPHSNETGADETRTTTKLIPTGNFSVTEVGGIIDFSTTTEVTTDKTTTKTNASTTSSSTRPTTDSADDRTTIKVSDVTEIASVSSPPPLYQTPRPGTAVTGYTSAVPPFPGGLLSSSSTTWKPSTTTDFILGPGACMFDGKVYVSAQQILRDDPCDFCFCFRGDIICLQQSCPPPVPGCFEEPIPGFCCPRYECPLTKAVVNVTTTTTPLPTYPPLQRSEEIVMCEIGDRYYHTGEIVEEASGPCLECRCGNDGMMECDPKDCPASPMLGKIFTKGRDYKNES